MPLSCLLYIPHALPLELLDHPVVTISNTKCSKVTIKTQQCINISIVIVATCFSVIRPAFRDMRYNLCISCTVGSHITYRVFTKIVKIIKKLYILKVGKSMYWY